MAVNGSIQVKWPGDEVEFFHAVVNAAIKTPEFRRYSSAALYQPFHPAAINFYRANAPRTRVGQPVKLYISYSPGSPPSAVISAADQKASEPPKPQVKVPVAAPLSQMGELIVGLLENSGSSKADVDIVVTPASLDLRSFAAVKGAPGLRDKGATSARDAVKGFVNLMSVSQNSPNPKIYTARFGIERGLWVLESWQKLAEIMPTPEPSAQDYSGDYYDEGQAIIDDVHASRRLVLDTAAMLIAEQDPSRLDNILWSIAPFAILKVGKIGKFAKLSKTAILAKIRPPRVAQLRRGFYHVDVKINPGMLDQVVSLRKTKYGVEAKDFKRNVTVWDVTIDGKRQFMDAGNVPISELNKKFGKGDVDVGFHSEPLLQGELQKLKKQGKDVKVNQIYTERICCARCREVLDYDDMTKNTPVFHSVNETNGVARSDLLMERYGITPD